VSNTTNLPLAAPITLTYDPNALGVGVPGFIVTGGPGGTLAYNPATESAGKTFTFAAHGGFTFSVSGTPSTGDTFTIQNNSNGSGDNRNALALVGLQSQLTMLNGATGPTASIYGAYSKIVSDVGARTKQAEIDSQAQNTMLIQAQDAWSNKSGVNLDEEAANLIKYQQIYQASAQIVVAASTIFDTLLSAVRR
jgi:flagellar hook-associated protein 1 FlgK